MSFMKEEDLIKKYIDVSYINGNEEVIFLSDFLAGVHGGISLELDKFLISAELSGTYYYRYIRFTYNDNYEKDSSILKIKDLFDTKVSLFIGYKF